MLGSLLTFARQGTYLINLQREPKRHVLWSQVLIYICNAPHRDLLLNYFHSLGVRVAHYCLSGTRESVEGRAKIAREKELFALPAAQLPIGGA